MKNIQWKTVAVIAAAIILLWLVFRSRVKRPDLPNTVPVIEQVKELNKQQKSVTDSGRVIRLMADTIRMLKDRVAAANNSKKASDKEVSRLVAVVKALPVDSTSKECDSLANAVTAYQDAANELQVQYDSVIIAQENKDFVVSGHLDRQKELYQQLRKSFDQVAADNTALRKSVLKENRKRKTERTINRILAGAVLVTGGLLITK